MDASQTPVRQPSSKKKLDKNHSMIIQDITGETVRPRRHHSAWTTFFARQQTMENYNAYGQTGSEHSIRTRNPQIGEKRVSQNLQSCSVGSHWRSSLEDFCEKTSLHGLKYIGDHNLNIVERLFWAVSFSLAMAFASYFIAVLYHKWNTSPVIVSIGAKNTALVDIPFPAVTVCTMNKAKKSVAVPIAGSTSSNYSLKRELLSDLCDNRQDPSYLDSPELQERVAKWEAIQEFMTEVGQPCHEMLHVCQYAGVQQPCVNVFNPALTDDGICCSFNKVKRDYIFRNPRDLSDLNVTFPMNAVDWTPERGYPKETPPGTLPFRPRGTGSHLGLTLLLDANVDEYYCSSTASVGFKMRLHNPVETPKIARFGFLLTPGREYRVEVTPIIYNASDDIRTISQQKRQCVFSEEKYLKFYRTYTQRNCALECEANYTLQECKCVPFYLPKDVNTKICAKKDELCYRQAQKIMEMRLVNEDANMTLEGGHSRPECECLPGCRELNYKKTLTYSKIPFELIPNVEYLHDAPVTKNVNYFRKNMAVVHIFFADSQFLNYYKGEIFGFTEFLSSTGGLLGLFLGFSFLSAIECLYYPTLRVWCNAQKVRRPAASLVFPNIDRTGRVRFHPFIK